MTSFVRLQGCLFSDDFVWMEIKERVITQNVIVCIDVSEHHLQQQYTLSPLYYVTRFSIVVIGVAEIAIAKSQVN